MVFGSLLEYAVVGYLGKRIAMRRAKHENLNKLREEHSQKCVAAAAATMTEHNVTINPESGGGHNMAGLTGGNAVGATNNQQASNQTHQTQINPQQTQLQNQLHHLHHHTPHQFICATTGLPLDPQIQLTCGLKTVTPVR